MTKTAAVEIAIINALKAIGRATARDIESHPAVRAACQAAKIKARAKLASLARQGSVKSCGSRQAPEFWC